LLEFVNISIDIADRDIQWRIQEGMAGGGRFPPIDWMHLKQLKQVKILHQNA